MQREVRLYANDTSIYNFHQTLTELDLSFKRDYKKCPSDSNTINSEHIFTKIKLNLFSFQKKEIGED